MHGRGACVVGGMCVAGGHAWQGGMCGRWACVAGGACMVGHAWSGGMRGRRDDHCIGRYASYWNAFLLFLLFIQLLSRDFIIIAMGTVLFAFVALPAERILLETLVPDL